MKQLNHNVALRVKLTQDVDTARETIQHLQDQLATTSSSYEKQLSTMSDHLCELNDKMMRQSEELEVLRRNKGKRWGK
ncbi:Protein phosphatase 1 regulatory subunit 21 [Geodia barretti]|uniref:Protein phosphatase 1 regulatory subunit 21 n=2 Tax=Geodia barretti TaxID=519541 RepID=A0AA35TFE8_GEOBA|nr:Protein phosphatase 1 regulatory subunit 21 [Geodia barretti]